MENFFARLIRFRLLIALFFILSIVGGVYSLMNLPIDAFPDLANNQVQILTECPGMAPLEAEQLVTIPIETLMSGLPSVVQTRSISKYSLSVVTVVFEDSVDTYFARQLVLERLQTAKSRIPKALDPQLGPISTAMGEIYQYVIDGPGYSPTDLKTLHDWFIKYQLRPVPGVAEVNSWGGYTLEYVVRVDAQKLMQYGITLQQIFDALQNNNANFGAGIIEHKAEQYIVRGVGQVNKLHDIEKIIVAFKGASPIYIANVATVEFGKAPRQGAVTQDGKGEVVTGLVMMRKGANSRQVIEAVKAKVKEIATTLPAGVTIKPFYDQTQLVEQTIETVKSNLLEGGALVVVVLLVLLRSFRAAFIVAAVIPLSMLFSFMGMRWLGISANVMSLGAIDFGMIVDGSIVMVENSLRRLSENHEQDTMVVIQDAVREMARPILFGVLIIAVVYMPILSLQGMEYKMFSPMVFTVCFALLGSLLLALTLVPVLCTIAFRGRVKEKESFIVNLVRGPYEFLLNLAMKSKLLVVGGATLLFVVALCSVPYLGTEFVPELDEGDLIIETRNIPSISLTEAVATSTAVEKALKTFSEVKTVVCKTGRPDLATDPMGVYQTDTYVIMNPRSTWPAGTTKERLLDDMRKSLTDHVIGATFNFTQPIAMRVDELVSGVRSDVAIKIFGDDLRVLQEKAEQIQQIVSSVHGQTDLQVERLYGSGQILIEADRDKLARYAFNESDVRSAVETAIFGSVVSQVLDGRKRFDLRVSLTSTGSIKPDQVGNLLIENASGTRVPLSQLAKIEIGESLDVVNREFAQRRIIVQCNVRGRDVGSFVREARQKVNQSVKLPVGYYIQWAGQFENQQRAMQRLSLVVPLSILIIFILLTATFGNIKHAVLVMLNVPFALIGGIAALWVRSMYLSVPAAIGFIALFGVAVLNGVVLVSSINRLCLDGEETEHAIKKAASMRLRPVLMTALVATLGFLPMAMSQGAGAEVQKPLATVVIGGLITSTFLTLFVLPLVYGWFGPPQHATKTLSLGIAPEELQNSASKREASG